MRRGVNIDLPTWLTTWETTLPDRMPDDATAMGAALEACRRNIRYRTGGPFGAVVVDADTGALLAVGVNLVVRNRASALHAEMVALTRAQQRLSVDNLSAGGRRVTLYSTAEPCAMCLGALPWSGIARLVCGARDADVRSTGFDEGDKPSGWPAKLHRRGLTVTRDVLRAEAVACLRHYRDHGGRLYGRGTPG